MSPPPAAPLAAASLAAASLAAPWRDPATTPLLKFEAITKRFGAFTAVDDLSLNIYEGEFFALLGPSGCGKTTLLRMLAGFETPDSGRIVLDGADIATVPPYQRPVNMMFQSYALFPHLTVVGNIAFGLAREGMPKAEIAERVSEMVRLARLEGMENRKPDQLSGGQRQRVALARALAKRPRILLLDEPLAALDKKLREETQFELMAIRERLNMTFIIVTHDQDEAMTLATRIGVMNRGRLAQVDEPRTIYERPATRYVAEFVGDINLFDGVADGAGHFRLAAPEAVFRIAAGQGGHWQGAKTLAVRPEKMALAPAGEGLGVNRLSGRIVDIGYLGDITLYRIKVDGGPVLRVTRPNDRHSSVAPFQRSETVDVTFAADAGSMLEG